MLFTNSSSRVFIVSVLDWLNGHDPTSNILRLQKGLEFLFAKFLWVIVDRWIHLKLWRILVFLLDPSLAKSEGFFYLLFYLF